MSLEHHPFRIGYASDADRAEIYRSRNQVYAAELGQHPLNQSGELQDALDTVNLYIVVKRNGRMAGFVSITPPSDRGYSVEKYLPRTAIPCPYDSGLFELRLLTVEPEFRSSPVAALLMYSAFRWIGSQGATHVIALGRVGATDTLYEKLGLRRTPYQIRSGNVGYLLMAVEL